MRRKQPEPTKFIATSSVDVPLIEKVVKEPGVEAVVRVPMPMQDWRKLIAAVLGGELSGHPTARFQRCLVSGESSDTAFGKGDWVHIVCVTPCLLGIA